MKVSIHQLLIDSLDWFESCLDNTGIDSGLTGIGSIFNNGNHQLSF